MIVTKNDDIQDLKESGTNMGASVTESVSGGIANVQDSVTQVSDHLGSIMMRIAHESFSHYDSDE